MQNTDRTAAETEPESRQALSPNRICVIGAGSSGLVSMKALKDAGLAFDCYEASDRLGGLWAFEEQSRGGAYRSLHINTSRDRMQWADYPMPRDYPDYPHHTLIRRYFEQYAEAFGLRDLVTFGTRVERVDDVGVGLRVSLSSGKSELYRGVVVANGHHWDASYPSPAFPGEFTGVTLHSRDYRSPTEPHDLRGKRVVVLGFGNSACDIACELSSSGAERVFLATRRGAWVLPKYVFGRPLDQLGATPSFLPRRLRQIWAEFLYRLVIGRLEDYGLPKPDHRLGGAHPTLSSELLPLLRAEAVSPKPNLRRFAGSEVVFEDGSTELVDAIVYATGYKVTFPFFDPDYVSAPDNRLPLYHRVFHPEHPRLAFIGLAQPLGAIMPIAEAQAKLVADYFAGRYQLPTRSEIDAELANAEATLKQRFVASRRHTMQVDFDEYMASIAREHAAGRQRAMLTAPHADSAAPDRKNKPETPGFASNSTKRFASR
jgi:cation diffusion facilitator CzcD-associated flavoprotein CzcO